MRGFNDWAIVELMGHRRLAGFVEEVELFGGKMLRIDVPAEPPESPATQFYGASAIYCVTPTTEGIARELARQSAPRPATRWELQALPARSSASEPPVDAEHEREEFEPIEEREEFEPIEF